MLKACMPAVILLILSFINTGVDDVEQMRINLINSISSQVTLVQSTIAKPICVGLQLMLFDPEQCFATAENINNSDSNRG